MAILILPIFSNAVETPLGLNPGKPVNVEADLLYQDSSRSLIYGKGKVILIQGSQKIMADEIIYHQTEDIIYTKGNVVLVREDGSVIFADEARFLKSAAQGVVVNFKGRFGQQGLLAAKGAEIQDETHIGLKEFSYTSCKICQDNIVSYTPIWQIRSEEAEINRETERIDYYGSTIELFGMPVFYTPYFNTPSPGAKRKTGLLLPKYSDGGLLGQTVTVPLYINIAPNMDATYYPRFTEKSGTLHQGEFRYLNPQGRLLFRTSYAENRVKYSDINKKESVGHYELKGEYRSNNAISPGFIEVDSKMMRNKEKTFLKKFDISSEDVLKTDVNYRYFSSMHYYSLRALHFQDLREGYSSKTTSAALPVFDGHFETTVPQLSSRFYTDINMLKLVRSQGTNYDRLTLRPGLKSSTLLPYGNLLAFDFSVRADTYRIDKKQVHVRSISNVNRNLATQGKQGGEARAYPELATEWSWPLHTSVSQNNIILEPVIKAMLAPQMTNLEKLTNEDSLDPEITAGNLFSTNRYKGFDKIESGPRVNYGIRGNISNPYINNVNFLFGQSRRKNPDKNFTRLSGMDGVYSDYVGKISFQLNKYLTVIDNFRMDKHDGKLLRNLTTLDFSYSKFSGSLTYSETNKRLIDQGRLIYNKEYISTLAYNFYKEWTLSGNIHGRFGKKPANEKSPLIKQGLMLQYLGDCLSLGFGVTRDYTKLKDLKPSTTYTYSLNIPVF